MAGKLRTAVTDRWRVVYRVYWRPLVAVVVTVYAVISLDSTLSGEFASDRVQKAIRLGNFIPHLSAWIWATTGLALFLMLGIEGALRESRNQVKAHADVLAERLADQQAQHEAALDAQRKDYEKKLAEATAPTAVNPAEWVATCDESGEFPDSKALVFGLRHRFDNIGAIRAFGQLKCTVTDPDGITTTATGTGLFVQYIPFYFPSAPPVRSGFYLFKWQGQKSNGEWVDITDSKYEVQPPPKTGLEVVIDNEIPTPFPGIGLILEIEFHVTNHDPMQHTLRRSMQATSPFYHAPQGTSDDPEHARLRQAYGVISERRRGDDLPRSVGSDETVRGVYIVEFAWDPTGKLPDYTLIISDGRRKFPVRPHGATESVPGT